jgi:Fe-S cluster assembly protein SufD
VRCTHGATIGQLDAEALFYLQTRGIGAAQARHLLTYAFAADLLERVKVQPLRDHFEHVLMRTLSEDPNAEETH